MGPLIARGRRALMRAATLVPLPPELAGERKLLPGLLALSDVLSTGHHAAVSAQVRPGATVAVVGDGAVGLCGVLAARRLGAERAPSSCRTYCPAPWIRGPSSTVRSRWPRCRTATGRWTTDRP
ncbi:hypothetical protein C9F11_41795 [Streptomyces sp. YIM 121038]|nr:hypothetical protein C9F11_41795 [Streptomyces sp. YIM 121038]